ncbi:MAG: GNAT family N-acetyltransferase [Prevotella sp.]|nr:GNAT family N-acetyltransferase [Prevotella sp.]
MEILIREIKEKDFPILEDLLYEAIFQPENKPLLPRKIIEEPEINVYINNFGSYTNDHCFVAEHDNKIIGAVWVRILAGEIKGFGNMDDNTPEFAISLYKEYRNKGIGSLLMNKMIEHLRKQGYKQTSLSVNKENYAVRMYTKLGFKIIHENEHDYLMVLYLN